MKLFTLILSLLPLCAHAANDIVRSCRKRQYFCQGGDGSNFFGGRLRSPLAFYQ